MQKYPFGDVFKQDQLIVLAMSLKRQTHSFGDVAK